MEYIAPFCCFNAMINLGVDGRSKLKRFARNRVHPFTYQHRDTDWERVYQFARNEGYGLQSFTAEYRFGQSDDQVFGKRGRRFFTPSATLAPEDLIGTFPQLLSYLEDPAYAKWYEPSAAAVALTKPRIVDLDVDMDPPVTPAEPPVITDVNPSTWEPVAPARSRRGRPLMPYLQFTPLGLQRTPAYYELCHGAIDHFDDNSTMWPYMQPHTYVRYVSRNGSLEI